MLNGAYRNNVEALDKASLCRSLSQDAWGYVVAYPLQQLPISNSLGDLRGAAEVAAAARFTVEALQNVTNDLNLDSGKRVHGALQGCGWAVG